MDGLKELDKIAYIRFASVYKNFKEAGEFEHVIEGNFMVNQKNHKKT